MSPMPVNASLLSSRLPGVSFLEPPRIAAPALPPLDVVGFVGFTERGPLDLPVALDDATQYADVFGGDLPLAHGENGQLVFAHLPAAVRSFFANGGRRCYVVRVAGSEPRAARFVVPGLAALDEFGFVRPALVDASSEGRWGTNLRLATRLAILPLPAQSFEIDETGLRWDAGSTPASLEPGDLLRLTAADGQAWLVPMTSVQPPSAPGERLTLQIAGAFPLTSLAASPPLALGPISRLGQEGATLLSLAGTAYGDDEETVLDLRGADAAMLKRGDLLELSLPDGRRLFTVTDARQLGEGGSPPELRAEARGGPMLRVPAVPLPVPRRPASVGSSDSASICCSRSVTEAGRP